MTRKALLAVAACVALAACVTGPADRASDRTHVHGPDDPDTVRGVLLVLHGCAGTFPHDWWAFMVDQGFLTVYVESGMAGQACRTTRAHARSVVSMRHRQAAHALEHIRSAYSGLPILVWGQSEGASVAQLVDAPVAGIITTGQTCGRYGLRIRPDVPWLHMIGGDDDYVLNKGHNCSSQRSDLWSYMILPGQGHRPALDSFREPLVAFLKQALG